MVSLISPAHLPPSFDAYADYPMASSSSTSFYPPPPGDDNFPPTQEASQSQTSYISPDFTSWAILDPFDQSMPQLDFGIPYPIIQIGRRPPPYNMFCLEGLKISAIHCKIEWDGFGGYKLQDLSHNGTFVNDVRVPKGQWRVIRNGDILAFGSRHLYKYVFKATNLDGINDPRFKYEIIQSIGSGSFGDVYKALVRETGTYVAIKHIRLAKKSYDASLVKRELVMLETFKHPNIVKFHHAYACTGDGIPGAGVRLVLEYVDGLDIANWSADRHVIDEAMYQHFFYQICEAMGYLHTLNVAHRDLKLENVLLTSHDPPIIKIADFGLAKVVDSRLTHFKTNCGTPITMAPEQCSASTYTTIVDSWAVGTMLYMLVCNELPIWGRRGNPHWYRNAARWKADLGEVLETFNATPISSAAKSFINCLLQWDPDHRAPLLSMLDEEWMQEYLPPVYDFTSDPPVKQRDLRRAHSNVRPPFPRPGGNRALPSSRVPPSPEQTGTGTVMPDTAPGADLHLYVPTVRDTSGSSGSIPGLGH